MLRLPFEAEGEPPAGFATVVVLPLRDEAAVELVGRLLTELDDALLLALPRWPRSRWRLDGAGSGLLRDAAGPLAHRCRRAGTFDAGRAPGAVRRPADGGGAASRLERGVGAAAGAAGTGVPAVLHAPTPTDEPMAWPALLLATFPLGPAPACRAGPASPTGWCRRPQRRTPSC